MLISPCVAALPESLNNRLMVVRLSRREPHVKQRLQRLLVHVGQFTFFL